MLQEHIWMYNAPGAYSKMLQAHTWMHNAPGAACIQIMLLENFDLEYYQLLLNIISSQNFTDTETLHHVMGSTTTTVWAWIYHLF